MTFLKTSFSAFTLFLFISNTAFCKANIGNAYAFLAQDTVKTYLPISGQRSLSLNINPIFSYLGNMFNGSTNNLFNISATSILYRKFNENNTVKRYRLNFGIATNENNIIGNANFLAFGLDLGTRRHSDFSFSFAYGKEKRYNYRKLALYTGWELLSGLSHYSTTYNYDQKEGDQFEGNFFPVNYTRRSSDSQSSSLHLGVAGLLGAEYYFSKMFFVGLELSVPIVVSISRNNNLVNEIVNVQSIGNIVRVTEEESQKARYIINGSFRSSNAIQFRAGIAF